MKFPTALPIDSVLPALRDALGQGAAAVLRAAPGAGKTTRVPLALLDEPWLAGKAIVMLEPRRLAARAAARRMAETLGESVGQTVGYRVRLDSKVSARTRIEVVTEGILTRHLQSDPSLDGIGLLIFDEFHERSIHSDLGLALALDVRNALRPDLKLLAMSATLDGEPVAALLGGAPAIVSTGQAFPVETRHVARSPHRSFEDDVAALIRQAIVDEPGSLLAFLPGEREIRRVAARLAERGLPDDVDLLPLYGAMPPQAQDDAIRLAAAARRKIVLATTIAETSLTIDGVRIVVDGGLKRVPRFDPRSGMSSLATVRVSVASAEQRRGRAGRLAPGICYRLWPAAEERGLARFDAPEMLQADLAPLALDLAAWGTRDPASLSWLDPPPAAAYGQATGLLRRLGALDGVARITAMGRSMAALPLHPRLAHMVVAGKSLGHGALACDLAALLSERDAGGERDVDVRSRLALLAGSRRGGAPATDRIRSAAQDLRRAAGVRDGASEATHAGMLLALGYPDRVARSRGPRGRFRLSGGGGAVLPETDALAAADLLAVAELDGAAIDARIFLAAPLTLAELAAAYAGEIAETSFVEWDAREAAVVARRQRRFGALVLDDRPLSDPDAQAVTAAMLEGIRRMGLDVLPWTAAVRALQQRVSFLRRSRPDDGWPDLSDAALAASTAEWLAPWLAGATRRDHLASLDLAAALANRVPWDLRRRLDDLAPSWIELPSGNRADIDYGAESGPRISVRLQELFGQQATPTIAGGRIALTVALLSPARRPLAITRDLRSFWTNVYPDVRAQMRGRYPRHAWPEDPTTAIPGSRAR